MLSDLLLHLRKSVVTLNHQWNTESVRRSIVLIFMILALLALIILAAYFTPMANAG